MTGIKNLKKKSLSFIKNNTHIATFVSIQNKPLTFLPIEKLLTYCEKEKSKILHEFALMKRKVGNFSFHEERTVLSEAIPIVRPSTDYTP